jgi:glycosyltransferase involved in cell wall biosynthesis
MVVPSSKSAAEYIVREFGVPEDRVRAVVFGVDRKRFRRANEEEKRRICARWSIPLDATLVFNARRFRPLWGSRVATAAFQRVARAHQDVHFVLLGGPLTENEIERARGEVDSAGLGARFTFIEGSIPLREYAELLSVADVFTSLMAAADMRSSSVLQGISAGAIPVISAVDEHATMAAEGYRVFLVDPLDADDVAAVLNRCLRHPEEWAALRRANDELIAAHADRERQQSVFAGLVDEVCSRFERDRRSGAL